MWNLPKQYELVSYILTKALGIESLVKAIPRALQLRQPNAIQQSQDQYRPAVTEFSTKNELLMQINTY
ncbi:hypothetical protein FGO68_gene13715 [Halteria grandinella]|uniref:Uncharacterized protein n=1 Tax=Halteria grandinella TaxID=5974 RepID=A0A8J8P307_HALGN|nr:hypothetical protein FGO68_gene13715 [Halteria grandinella]